jgi:hypothetical protein
MNYYDIDRRNRTYKLAHQLWVSYGKPDTVQMLADNLPQLSLAVKPGGSEIVYLSSKGISKLDQSLKELPSVFFDPSHWDYATTRRNEFPLLSFEMTWQPGTSPIFLHNKGGELGPGYTFILNVDSGRICELNLNGWAVRAYWSLDGHYLAIIRVPRSSSFFILKDLAVLDIETGKLSTMTITSQSEAEDFVWAPDNRHFLTHQSSPFRATVQGETLHHELYLVDFVSGQSIHLFPEYKSFFADGAPMNNFAWSADGSKLLARCPTNIVDRVCLISIQRTRQ